MPSLRWWSLLCVPALACAPEPSPTREAPAAPVDVRSTWRRRDSAPLATWRVCRAPPAFAAGVSEIASDGSSSAGDIPRPAAGIAPLDVPIEALVKLVLYDEGECLLGRDGQLVCGKLTKVEGEQGPM